MATTDDTAVALLAASTEMIRNIAIINEGAAAGFFSDDGGTTWSRLPTGTIQLEFLAAPQNCPAITVKRIAGGSNLSDVYAFAW